MMPIIIYRIKDIFSPVANTWDQKQTRVFRNDTAGIS